MINITYINSVYHHLVDFSNISIAPSTLIPDAFIVENNTYIVVCKYNGWLEDFNFNISLKWANSRGVDWTAISSFSFTQLTPCIEDNP